MENYLLSIALSIILLPLLASLIAGLIGKKIGKRATHTTAVSLIGTAFILSCFLVKAIVIDGHPAVDGVIYHWVSSGAFPESQ